MIVFTVERGHTNLITYSGNNQEQRVGSKIKRGICRREKKIQNLRNKNILFADSLPTYEEAITHGQVQQSSM